MTREELETYIQWRCTVTPDDTDLLTAIRHELNRVYMTVPVVLEYKISEATATLVQDQVTYTLASDVKLLKTVRAAGIPLRPIGQHEYQMEKAALYDDDDSAGQPEFFTQIADNQINLLPVASSIYAGETMTYSYVPAVTAMSASTDVPDQIPEEFHLMLAEYAIEAVFLADEDPSIAAQARARGDVMYSAYSQYLAKRNARPIYKRRIKGQRR